MRCGEHASNCIKSRSVDANLGWSNMNRKLLDILVCPVTKGPLIYDKKNQELISKSARLVYPIRDGIPVMLEEEARALSQEEYEKLK
jgi:uncharacterized protein YbaR (Trm112 family)